MRIGGTLAIAAALAVLGCGSDHVTDSRASVLLFIESIAEGSPILSDIVSPGNTVVNCDVAVSVAAILKNPGAEITDFDTITLTSYRVEYRRSDGQNVEGVHVPYTISGPVTVSVAPGEDTEFPITMVRHQAKIEPPLKNITALDIVTVSANVTLFGQTRAGQGVSAEGNVQITFADYGDGTATCETEGA